VAADGREDVPQDLPRGGPLLEVPDDRARARAKGKAAAAKQPPRPPLTAEQRRECENLRSKAYHATRKATNDLGLSGIAGMRAKEQYLNSRGYGEFKCLVRGPNKPQAKAASMAAPAAEATAEPAPEPPAKKPRSAKQLEYQAQVKGAMAELRAQGAPVSIAAAASLLRERKAAGGA
jgi:hypothetical protein